MRTRAAIQVKEPRAGYFTRSILRVERFGTKGDRTMRKALASAALLLVLLAPMVGHADVSVRQDSCNVYFENFKQFTKVWFTVINFSLPAPVCEVSFLSEPYPPTPNCIMVATGAPAGWSSNLIDPGQADWFATAPAACIPPDPAALSGFWFDLDPGFCCYVVQFKDEAGAVMLEQEECFCDNFVSVKDKTWGDVKTYFRE
jgi:hypothetical protein